MPNQVNLQKIKRMPNGDVRVRVLSEDLGYGDAVAVQLKNEGDAVALTVDAQHDGQLLNGQVDRWVATIPASQIAAAGLNKIVATTLLRSPDGNSITPEYQNHTLEAGARPSLVGKRHRVAKEFERPVIGELDSGRLELGFLFQQVPGGKAHVGGNVLEKVRFTPTPGQEPFFKDAAQITLAIYPITEEKEGGKLDKVNHHVEQLTTITLDRQSDGTYAASPPNEIMAFADFEEFHHETRRGDWTRRLTGVRVALAAEGADSRSGQGYDLPVLPHGFESYRTLRDTLENALQRRGFYEGRDPAGFRPRLDELLARMDLSARDVSLLEDLVIALAGPPAPDASGGDPSATPG